MVQILQIIITIVITCFSSALNEAEKDAKECFSYNLPKEIDLINLNECNKTKTYTRYVFNGKLAAPNTFPYIVSLQHYGNHFCGGSIVHRRWVMTAKHCISSRRIGVKVNLDNNNRGAGKVYYARRTFVHPGSSIIDGDVALLMLDENIDFEGGKIHKIRLGLNDPASDTPLTLAGWGKTERGNPTRLMTEQTIFRSTRVCRRYLGWSFVPEKMICAKGSRGDACFGDSGGPLVLKGSSTKDDYQYGVVSWGRNPCGSSASAYARVSRYRAWVENILRSNGYSLEDGDSDDAGRANKGPARQAGRLRPGGPPRGRGDDNKQKVTINLSKVFEFLQKMDIVQIMKFLSWFTF